jgi:hypothetical protein
MSNFTIKRGEFIKDPPPATPEEIARTTVAARKLLVGGKYPCKDCGKPIPDDGTAKVRVYPRVTETLNYAEIVCAGCAKLESN